LIANKCLENERLPTELGWKKPGNLLQENILGDLMDRLINATGFPDKGYALSARKRDIHSGFRP